jgi:hypothetical protein
MALPISALLQNLTVSGTRSSMTPCNELGEVLLFVIESSSSGIIEDEFVMTPVRTMRRA